MRIQVSVVPHRLVFEIDLNLTSLSALEISNIQAHKLRPLPDEVIRAQLHKLVEGIERIKEVVFLKN